VTPSAVPNARKLRQLAAVIVVVVVAVTATHWPALSSRALCFDDAEYVLDNPLVQNPSWDSVRRFLTEILHPSTVGGYYQPLTMISLMLDYAQASPQPSPEQLFRVFHRTSLVLHVANAALLTVLIYLLFGNAAVAGMVGVIFGLHPMTVEPIPWLGERKTLLSAFFALACLVTYVRYTQCGRAWQYAAALALFVLALLSKPISMPLPICLIVMDWWPLRRLSRASLREKIPFFAIAAASALITFSSQSATFGVETPAAKPPEWVPLLLSHDLVFYVRTLLWPVDLTPHYPLPQPLSLSNLSVVASAVGALLLVGGLIAARRWSVAPLAAAAFFVVAVLPTTGIVGFSVVPTSDKFAYLPAVGLLMALAALLLWLHEKLRARWGDRTASTLLCLTVAGIAALEACGTRTYYTQWRDTETLDKHMLALAPNSPDAHSAYATELIRQERYDEAIGHLNAALAIDPADAQVHNNLGVVLAQQGRIDEAIEHFSFAVKERPNFAVWRRNLDMALADRARRSRGQP
jgi:hypothetical protein